MLRFRQVRVLPADDRWCMWTEEGELQWFAEQFSAVQAARLWAYTHRPAEALLEIPGTPAELLSRYDFGAAESRRIPPAS